MTPTLATQNSPQRLVGLDLARGLALLGMLIVNFDLIVSGLPWGAPAVVAVAEGLQGRAAATFVLLAGMGTSLGIRAAGTSPEGRRFARARLLRRAAFLFVGGTLFLTIWPADILHHYGLWLALGAGLAFAPTLLLVVAAGVAADGTAVSAGSFLEPWNLLTLEYQGLWEPVGFVRHLFLDGFHPLLPWFAFYAVGMLLGRLPLEEARTRARIAACAGLGVLVSWTLAVALPGDADLLHLLATPRSFPPTPNFALMGASVAALVVVAALVLAERLPRLTAPFAATGRLALTLYVAHVLVGFGVLEEMGRLGGESRRFALQSALVFYVGAVLFSSLWLRWRKNGPLEALMRRMDPPRPEAPPG